ncbi:MAG TPA: hypothetical protein VF070_08705 [Streptosporangiaceae bacterium]
MTTPFVRRTPPLTGALVKVALSLAGRAGSRLAAALARRRRRPSPRTTAACEPLRPRPGRPPRSLPGPSHCPRPRLPPCPLTSAAWRSGRENAGTGARACH